MGESNLPTPGYQGGENQSQDQSADPDGVGGDQEKPVSALVADDHGLPTLPRETQPQVPAQPYDSPSHQELLFGYSPDQWMVFLTFVITLFGSLTTFISYKLYKATLKMAHDAESSMQARAKETEIALEYARESAKAAQDMVRDGRQEAILKLRPYLSVESISNPTKKRNGGHEVDIKIRNSGRTTAVNTTCRCVFARFPTELPDGFEFVLPDTPIASFSISPKSREIVVRGLKRQEASGTDHRQPFQTYYCFGEICYSDAFGGNYVTRFTQKFEVVPSGGELIGSWLYINIGSGAGNYAR